MTARRRPAHCLNKGMQKRASVAILRIIVPSYSLVLECLSSLKAPEHPLQAIQLHLINQRQLRTQFALGKALAVIPDQIGLRKIEQLPALVLAVGHHLIDGF